MSGQDLDALNLTKLCKGGSQVILLEFGGEVLDEEVALLLRVLESLLLSEDHTLSLNSCQSRLHVELATIDLLIVEFLDSSLSRKEASITVFRILEADEGKLALRVSRVLLDEDRLDKTELSEDFMDLTLTPLCIKVLDVDIVGHSLKILRVFRLELNGLDSTKLFCSYDCLGMLLVLKANETVANRVAWLSLIYNCKLFALLVDLGLEDRRE